VQVSGFRSFAWSFGFKVRVCGAEGACDQRSFKECLGVQVEGLRGLGLIPALVPGELDALALLAQTSNPHL